MAEYKTESQKAYEAIRHAILSGRFRPGDRLPQRRMAEQFGATTITVREALRYLENEGLVAIEPKWGATVVEVTRERIFGRYVVREALEGMAARLAAEHMTPAIRDELLARAAEVDRVLVREDLSPNRKAEIHYQLHERIAELSQCEELRAQLGKLNLHTIILANAYRFDWTDYTEEWHQTLIRAIASGDPEEAERMMRVHVRRGYDMETAALDRARDLSAEHAASSE